MIYSNDIIKAIYETDKDLITNVNVFDFYKKDNITSIGISVTFQPTTSPLDKRTLNYICDKIVKNVYNKTGAVINFT